MTKNKSFVHDGYVVLRRPLLPIETSERIRLLTNQESQITSTNLFKTILNNSTIASAIQLVNPELYDRLKVEVDAKVVDELLPVLMRYVIRMSTRATPLGAFASVGIGGIGIHKINNFLDEIECILEIDCGALVKIKDKFEKSIVLDEQMLIRINPAHYELGESIRFLERNLKGEQYDFNLAKISTNEYLHQVTNYLKVPRRVKDVLSVLISYDQEISPVEGMEYLQELVNSQLFEIITDVQLVGGNTLARYLAQVRKSVGPSANANRDLEVLKSVAPFLGDRQPVSLEVAIKNTDLIETAFKERNLKIRKGRSVHVDTFLKCRDFIFPEVLLNDIFNAIEKLHKLFPKKENESIAKFSELFEKRFGENFVPLGIALDSESGIPFGYSAPINQWSRKLAIKPKQKIDQKAIASIPWKLLKYNFISERREIDICELDIPDIPGACPLPSSFSANVSIFDFQEDGNNTKILLNNVAGAGCGNIIARFGARHEAIGAALKDSIDREEKSNSEVIFAEIIHTPGPRVMNVLARPSIRKYEIVLSGVASVEDDYQILINDLYVGCMQGRVVLWSKRLGKEVIPCLTSAHNFSGLGNLAIYQFLCALRNQATSTPNFFWPSQLNDLPKLPRVNCGPIIVALAKWRLQKQSIDVLVKNIDVGNWVEVKKYFLEIELPQFFSLEENDNVLEVNQECYFSLGMFADAIRNLNRVSLIEAPARIGRPIYALGDEKWHSEIIIPIHVTDNFSAFPFHLIRKKALESIEDSAKSASILESGDSWHYFKIYGGEQALESLLTQQIAPMIYKMELEERIKKWHFLRFTDSGFHLRIRLFGKPKLLALCALELSEKLFIPKHRSYEISAVNTELYLPEYSRYGGIKVIPFVETLFHIDSLFSVEILRISNESKNTDIAWKGALSGIFQYLEVFFEFKESIIFSTAQRDAFRQEMDIGKFQFDRLGEQYREHREYVENILTKKSYAPTELLNALNVRSNLLTSFLESIERRPDHDVIRSRINSSLASVVHMLLNRLFTSSSRPQEFVIWEYIVRAFRSIEARQQQ
ncbi:lantibiotic dehydratase [Undibacterium sp. TJN19]|uniref:lantibiotic dehydratase n=1 Tax=Undibacterium sp. TJN19 TaxID=3413055 RepID=UPI003BF32729